jgi:hypothetical protein
MGGWLSPGRRFCRDRKSTLISAYYPAAVYHSRARSRGIGFAIIVVKYNGVLDQTKASFLEPVTTKMRRLFLI